MASIRLTQSMRSAIRAAAIAAAFDERFKKLSEDEDRLARQLYNRVFPISERRAAADLPDNWLRVDSCLRFNVGGMRMEFTLLNEGVRVLYKAKGSERGGYSCQTLGSVTDEKLINSARDFFGRKEDAEKEKSRATYALSNLLEGVTTVKALSEIWPEGAPYYQNLTQPEPSLPAPMVADINAMLGLHQLEQAAA